MGLLSILLSALAVVCAGVGVLTTPIPKLGLVFAFGAPVLAIAGIMLGGSAMSKAKRAGQTSETGRIGAILSALAFVPSVVVALTCGVCNAFFTTGDLHVQKDFRFNASPFGRDAGARGLPAPQRVPPADPNAPDAPNAPPDPDRKGSHLQPGDRPRAPDQPQAPGQPDPQAPGSAPLPPPPLPPGPGK